MKGSKWRRWPFSPQPCTLPLLWSWPTEECVPRLPAQHHGRCTEGGLGTQREAGRPGAGQKHTSVLASTPRLQVSSVTSGDSASPPPREMFFFFFLRFYLFIFRERGKEGEREGEKHQCVVASHTPPTGDLASTPGMCPGLGTEPATLWVAGPGSIHWATLARHLMGCFEH